MLLKILQNFEFGSFDEFPSIATEDVSDLDKLNLTEIYQFMMHDCRDFFVSCWWKKTAFNCCDWFSLQRSMYGLCWSFNSFSSVGSPSINVSTESDRKFNLNIFKKLKTIDFDIFFNLISINSSEINEFSMAHFRQSNKERTSSSTQHTSKDDGFRSQK